MTISAALLASACGDEAGPADGQDDLDGLAPEAELAGWDIIVDESGYGLDADASFLTRRHVTSDPFLTDTDGDGLSDAEERVDRTDPRAADTDGDGLTDRDEKRRYRTNPLTVDSDGDARSASIPLAALFDGAEVTAHTSPTLADTDGDGASDLAERDVPGRDPRIAEIPRAQIAVAGLVTIEMNVEYSDGTLTEKTYGKDFSTTTASRTSRSDSESTAVTIAASSGGEGFFDDLELSPEGAVRFFGGKMMELGRQTTCDFIDEGQINVGPIHFDADDPEQVGEDVAKVGALAKDVFGAVSFLDDVGGCDPATPETTTTTSTTLTTESSREATEAYSEYVTDQVTHTETASSGIISVGLSIRNIGPSTFDVKNPSVTLMQWQASPTPGAVYGAGAFRTLATLAVTEGGVLDQNGNRTFTLAPNAETIVQVVNDDVNPEFIKSLLARPQALFLEPASFQVSDPAGANFQYLTENTITRTATIVIDDGVHDPARYLVATNVARTDDGELAGINMREALTDVLGLPYTTRQVTRPTDSGDATVEVHELDALGGLANQRSANRGSPELGIPGDPQGFWIVYVKREAQSKASVDFDDIDLLPGDEVRMIFARDEDGDGLMRREEIVYGTSDTEPDSDGDGLSDFVEAKVGWDIDVAYVGKSGPALASYRVASDPILADGDGDGLDDGEERDLGTDPARADTDDDGLRDRCESSPRDHDAVDVASDNPCVPTVRHVYVGSGSNLAAYAVDEGSGALSELDSSPATAPAGGVVDVAVTPDGAHAYTAAGQNGSVPVAAWDLVDGAVSANPYPGTETSSGSGLRNWSSVAITTDGAFLFATDEGPDNDRLVVYAIGASLPGQLTEVQSLRDDVYRPSLVVVDPLGRFVFAGGRSSEDIGVYALTDDAGAPLSLLATRELGEVNDHFAVSPDGQWFYATPRTGGVAVYRLGDDGSLTQVAGSPFAVNAYPSTLAIDPRGRFVFVANDFDDTIAVLRVTPTTGTLLRLDIDGDALNGPTDLVLTAAPNDLAINPAADRLFAATDLGVVVLDIDPTSGALTTLTGPIGPKAETLALRSQLR